MIYQVDYIDQRNYDANCTNTSDPTSEVTNNALWVGFRKATKEEKLTHLLKPYLIYIVVVSAHSFILLWQTIKRIHKNKPPRTPTVLFKKVRRADADKDIPHLIKYLFNYGFYKFGVEICLISYVGVIAYRMDIIACGYAIWLFFIYNLQREEARKVWSYAVRNLILSHAKMLTLDLFADVFHYRFDSFPIFVAYWSSAWLVHRISLEWRQSSSSKQSFAIDNQNFFT